MFLLRYVALAALVIWLGGMILLLLAGAQPADLMRLVHRVALVCGSVLLVALFAMKLIGPPPGAFPRRAAVAGGMLVLAIASSFAAAQAATALTAVNAAGGLFLLSFYVRE